MQPPLSFANALVQLKLLVSQTANFTFTNDELTQALTTAWQDSFVGNVVWDSSLTYTMGTYQYALPATVTVVRDVYIIKPQTNTIGGSGNYPEKISQELYEVVNGNLQFFQLMQNFVNDTRALYIKGFYKIAVTDNLNSDSLINYVLSNAAYILIRNLALKRAFTFLKNDTTMGEIIQARNLMRDDMLMYKRLILREFESL